MHYKMNDVARRIQVGDVRLDDEERKAIVDVVSSGRISEGMRVKEFEGKWAKFIGTKYSILLNSGTSALIAGLAAMKHDKKIKEKTKVITSPVTYVATSNAIVLNNLEPVYVDVDEHNFLITPDKIKEHLEDVDDLGGYSAILPVHLVGYACDMDEINKIAKEHRLITIEDSSQAHGTSYKGKHTGSLSSFSTFSFYIAHNIQAGEMGAINTDDINTFRLIKKIKANGRVCDCSICTRTTIGCPKIKSYKDEYDFDPRFTHDLIGYNFKVMEFQAALALVQLNKVSSIIKKRQENVRYLNEGLGNFSDVLRLPSYSKDISYMVYPLVIKKQDRISRKKLRNELEKKGIETRPLFGCIPTQQPAYNHLKGKYGGRLPNAEYIGKNAFYIGCHQYLGQEDLEYVIKSFKEILKNHV